MTPKIHFIGFSFLKGDFVELRLSLNRKCVFQVLVRLRTQ